MGVDPKVHDSDGRSFEPDKMGFYTARCSCRWKFGPLPDQETLTDVLMAHAYEMGVAAAVSRGR